MTNSVIQSLMRHDTYYISSADLSILVERIQFRVHRYFFERESEYFRRQLVTPTSPGAQQQGSNDSTAIILENVTPAEFARFLWVFYNPRYSLYDEASCSDWQSILRLAHIWLFPEVKSLAVRELEKQPMLDVKRIKLYHENDVDRNLLVPRYAALCEREASLTLVEGMDLGMETTLMIAQGREEARSQRLPSGMRSPLTATIHGADLYEVVRELFKIAPPEDGDVNAFTETATTATIPPAATTTTTATNGHNTDAEADAETEGEESVGGPSTTTTANGNGTNPSLSLDVNTDVNNTNALASANGGTGTGVTEGEDVEEDPTAEPEGEDGYLSTNDSKRPKGAKRKGNHNADNAGAAGEPATPGGGGGNNKNNRGGGGGGKGKKVAGQQVEEKEKDEMVAGNGDGNVDLLKDEVGKVDVDAEGKKAHVLTTTTKVDDVEGTSGEGANGGSTASEFASLINLDDTTTSAAAVVPAKPAVTLEVDFMSPKDSKSPWSVKAKSPAAASAGSPKVDTQSIFGSLGSNLFGAGGIFSDNKTNGNESSTGAPWGVGNSNVG